MPVIEELESAAASSDADLNDPWVRVELGLALEAAAAAAPAALPAAQPAPLPAAQPDGDQHHYPQHNPDQHHDPQHQLAVRQLEIPPPPPRAPRPAQHWTIYGFLYEVMIAGSKVVANIFLASGPQFPRGGPHGPSLVQFWWPDGAPGAWHGSWQAGEHGPGSLFIEFNGRRGPNGPLHGVYLLGNGREFAGWDYRARHVIASLYDVWAVVDGDVLQRRERRSWLDALD